MSTMPYFAFVEDEDTDRPSFRGAELIIKTLAGKLGTEALVQEHEPKRSAQLQSITRKEIEKKSEE